MSTISAKARLTPDDLAALPDQASYELVDGKLVERPMASFSSWIGGVILHLLSVHCNGNRLGWVFGPDEGYQCFPEDPNRIRKADVSFIRAGRLPGEVPGWTGYQKLAPDLAVEVLSPNDLAADVHKKIDQYLGAGVRLIWVVIPETREVRIHRSDRTVSQIGIDGELTGEDVVPGFRCRVAELFTSPVTGEQLLPPAE